jgi:subtilisin family serine protease
MRSFSLSFLLGLAFSTSLPAIAAVATAVQAPSAQGFLKFSNEQSLVRFLQQNPNQAERLHPKLLWVFGDGTTLNRALVQEASGALPASFSWNQKFSLPKPSPRLLVQEQEDPRIDGKLWGISRMSSPQAWRITQGEGVIVAVLDTGLDTDHPALKDQIAINAAEAQGQEGVDDDGNGYVDDVQGWDFYDVKASPEDDEGHGTHVAGTIAGYLPGEDFYGVAPRAKILPVKTHNSEGAGREDAVVKGILYAADSGAKVINCSWGGEPEAPQYSQVLFDAISYAGEKGALLVAAAGNESNNNDRNETFPANYKLPNVMAVAATTSQDRLALFSNFGATTVHVAAPGMNIYSARKGGGFKSESGTSMAAPHAAGAAALVYASARQPVSAEEVRGLLMREAKALPSLNSKVVSGLLSLDFLAQ